MIKENRLQEDMKEQIVSMKRDRALATLLAASLAGAAAGCHKRPGEGAKIGLVLADAVTARSQGLRDAAQLVAKRNDFDLVVQDGRGDAGLQEQAVTQLLEQKVPAMAIEPVEPDRLKELVQRVGQAGGAVVMMDRGPAGVPTAGLVQFNEALAGQLCADYLRFRLKDGGKVAIIKGPAYPGQQERLHAFRQYLNRYPKLRPLPEESARDGSDRASVDLVLAANPDLKAVFTLDDPVALLAVQSIRVRQEWKGSAAGSGGPVVVSCGGTPEAVAELQKADSPLALTVAAIPQVLGRRAVLLAWRHAARKPAPSRVLLPPLPVTKENAKEVAGWQAQFPKTFQVPWQSDLKVEVERAASGGASTPEKGE